MQTRKILGPRLLAVLTFTLGSVLASEVGAQDFPLFAADYRGVGVYSLDAAGNLTVRGFVSGPLNSVRNDRDGNLYTCSEDSSQVSKIDPAGHVSVYATDFKGCFGLLFARDGTLYVSNLNAGRIEAVPPGGGPSTTLATGLDGPTHMAFDTDGSILVNEFGLVSELGGQLSRVDGKGNVSPVVAGLNEPVGVVVGPDTNIYVSEVFTGRIMRIDRAGKTSLLAARGDAGPTGLDFHRDGRLFVAELFAGQIAMVDVSTGAVTVFRNGLAAPVGLSFRREFVIEVDVDLKPGSDPNPLNPKSNGVVPVAVLGRAAFDATRIDPSTIRFGVTGTEAAPVHSHVEDVDGDGRPDMVFHFRTRTLGIPLTLPGTSRVPLKLTGQTLDGQAIEGEDVARITPNG